MDLITIRFVNFQRSEALEDYTYKHVRSLLRRLQRRPGEAKSIDVQFKLDARAPMGSLKNSEVLVHYRYPGIRKALYIKKNGTDLRSVLLDAIEALEAVVQRSTEKAESGRRNMGKTKRKVRELKAAH